MGFVAQSTGNYFITPSANDVASTAGDGSKLRESLFIQLMDNLVDGSDWVVSGFDYVSAAGLVATFNGGTAILNGRIVKIQSGATFDLTLTASVTNHVWLTFELDGNSNITNIGYEVNSTGTPPTNASIKLEELVTDGSGLTGNTDSRTLYQTLTLGGLTVNGNAAINGALSGITTLGTSGLATLDSLTVTGAVILKGSTMSTFIATLFDDATQGDAQTTLGVDPSGTDNSTDVTLGGSLDYLTLSGQVLTRNAIDLSADVTGVLPVANGGTALTSISTLLNSNVTPTTLSLVIGVDTQAYSSVLDGVSAGTYTIPAERVDPGTFPSGAYVFQGALSGITSLTMSGALALGSGTITTTGAVGTGALTVTGTGNINYFSSVTNPVGLTVLTQRNDAGGGTAYGARIRAYGASVSNAQLVGLDAHAQHISAASITSAIGVNSQITNSGGASVTSARLFNGIYNNTIAGSYGLYIAGEDKNYLSGKLLIGTTTDTYGTLQVSGEVMFGLATSSGWYTYQNTLNGSYASNADTNAWINFRGYQNGATQFRDLTFGDGKEGEVARIDGSAKALTMATGANTVMGTAELLTTAMDGFAYLSSCAGTPVGTPTTNTGTVPLIVDTTNDILYFHSSAAWREVTSNPASENNILHSQVFA